MPSRKKKPSSQLTANYSPFADLLKSGGRFQSDVQRQRLAETISRSMTIDIPNIDQEILELRSKIQCLLVDKRKIQVDVSKFRVFLTPINRLPTEVIINIFLIHCNPPDDQQERTTTITAGVWPLSHVSREWRAIALSLPELWSNIKIGVIEKPAKNELELLNTALMRSGSHPLSIRASFSWASGGDDPNGFPFYQIPGAHDTHDSIPDWPSEKQLSEAMVKAVVRHSNRWKTADIQVLYNLSCLLPPIYGQLASLEKLVFAGEVDDHPHIFRLAPKLRDIEFFNSDSSAFQLPWKQLVRFHESRWNVYNDLLPRFLRILQQYPQLEDFGVEYDGEQYPPTQLHVTHSQLKALSCSDPRFIESVTLPSLQELHLKPTFMRKCPPATIPSVCDLFLRSNCASKIRVLQLQDVILNRDVFALLELTNSLTDFDITFAKWATSNDRFMRALVQRLSSHGKSKKEVLLPRLESFTVNIEAINGFEWFKCDIGFIDEKFVDMVEERWRESGNGISQIQVIKFEGYTPATLNAFVGKGVDRMKEMRDEGLEIYIATMDIASTNDDRKEMTYVK